MEEQETIHSYDVYIWTTNSSPDAPLTQTLRRHSYECKMEESTKIFSTKNSSPVSAFSNALNYAIWTRDRKKLNWKTGRNSPKAVLKREAIYVPLYNWLKFTTLDDRDEYQSKREYCGFLDSTKFIRNDKWSRSMVIRWTKYYYSFFFYGSYRCQ